MTSRHVPTRTRLPAAVLAAILTLCQPAAAQPTPEGAAAQKAAVDSWSVSGDFNAIGQEHGHIDSPLYIGGTSAGSHDGVLSLAAARENSHSLVSGINVGHRAGAAGEIWLRPELTSGIPMGGATGLAAFTNSDTQKFMTVEPTAYLALVFARYSWELGGASEPVEGHGTVFTRMLAHDHVTVQVGKMDLLSLFDDNRWAHKGSDRFLNWCFMTSCAYDFAADARGYTIGAFTEYQWGDWSIRGGRFTLPKVPNQLALDHQIFSHYEDNLELERRFENSTVRLLAYHNRMKLASYGGNGVLAPIPTAADGNDPTLPNPRIERDKYGLGLNGEVSPFAHFGLFGRLMVTSANTETNAFTEADHALELGTVGEGEAWRRPLDNAGVALGINAAGGQRRRYLERWLPSLLLGDGQQAPGANYYSDPWFGPTPAAAFHYGREVVAEAYYLYGFSRDAQVTLDLQRIINPAYNRDRGPVDVFSIRVHGEF